jgi:hypothetical protein
MSEQEELKQQLINQLQQTQQLQFTIEVLTEQRNMLMEQLTELSVAMKVNALASERQDRNTNTTIKALEDTLNKINAVAESAKVKFRACGWYLNFITNAPRFIVKHVPWLDDVEQVLAYHNRIKEKRNRYLVPTAFDEHNEEDASQFFEELGKPYDTYVLGIFSYKPQNQTNPQTQIDTQEVTQDIQSDTGVDRMLKTIEQVTSSVSDNYELSA